MQIIEDKNSGVKFYCFNHLFEEFADESLVVDLYYYCKQINDFTIYEKYLDLFKNYIDDIIDYSDYFTIDIREERLLEKLKKIKEYEIKTHSNLGQTLHYGKFKIIDNEDKKIIKNIFSFNVTDDGEQAMVIPIDREYLRNNKDNLWVGNNEIINFYKDGKEIFVMNLDDGNIWDYRSNELYEASIDKYNDNSKERIELKEEFFKAINSIKK